MDLERLRDERVVSFLLRVMADPGESSELRIHVLKRLRSRRLTADERSAVPGALGELMLRDGSIDLQLQAALALGEFYRCHRSGDCTRIPGPGGRGATRSPVFRLHLPGAHWIHA